MTNSEARKLMKLHGHKFGFCPSCGPMIICGYCGNNCCNGGSGFYSQKRVNGKIVANYQPCIDDCHEAYEIQDSVKFPWYMMARYYIQIVLGKKVSLKLKNLIYHIKTRGLFHVVNHSD
jgi:hypothetical protein